MTREKSMQEARETKFWNFHTRAQTSSGSIRILVQLFSRKVVSRNFSLFSRSRAAPVIKFLGTKYARVYYVCVLNAEKRIYESVIISMITNSKKSGGYFVITLRSIECRLSTRNFRRISNVCAFKCIVACIESIRARYNLELIILEIEKYCIGLVRIWNLRNLNLVD